MLSQGCLGWLAISISAIGYGSLFVPVKNYEVYDGLVYQWFQCCGILLFGMAYACWQNDWDAPGMSAPGFYVCKEGILSGIFFQAANVLATHSVKLFGMGNYFTTHEVTNLGGAFFFGVFGPRLGIPSTPPSHPGTAFLGFVFVLLGMIPVGFTEEEGSGKLLDDCAASEAPKRASSWHGAGTPPQDRQEATSSLLQRIFGSLGRGRVIPRNTKSTLTRAGTSMLLVDDEEEGAEECEDVSQTQNSSVGKPEKTLSAPLLVSTVVKTDPKSERGTWLAGLSLSLLAGIIFSFMYIPLLPWTARMERQGLHVSSFDYFFSISVGLFLASTAYLFLGGALKKYQGKKMQKSVLRPALMTGVMWSVASMAQLYALSVIPYAVAYCLVCGGGLTVSLLWGVFVFGEASTPHNFRCTVASFVGVLVGMSLVAMAK